MWNLDVPKICHVYWGGEVMPYIRYLTIKSFMILNPDWEVWLWMPQKPSQKVTWASKENDYPLNCNNFLPIAMSLPIKKMYVDFPNIEEGRLLAEVHRADYIRIKVMEEHGGLWADSDILFFRPMRSMSVNTLCNRDKDVYVTLCDYGHSTGFLMARPHSIFYRRLKSNVMSNFVATHYQCIGPIMFNKYFPKLESIPSVINISMDVVYRYRFQNVSHLINTQQSTFTSESIGCHWYGGNTLWSDFINRTNGGFVNVPPSVIGDLLKPYSLVL